MFNIPPTTAKQVGQLRALICVFCNEGIAPWYVSRKPTHVISGTGFGRASQYACDECMETHRRAEDEAEAEEVEVQMGMDL